MSQLDTTTEVKINKLYNSGDVQSREKLQELLSKSPIPSEELFNNIGLFLDRRIISRFLFINELYQKILPIHGNIFELGVRY